MSQRRAARLIPVDRMTLRYEHHRDSQEALRVRLRELAGSRVRYGYRRLTVLLKREGLIPLPVGEVSKGVKIPHRSIAGELLSQLLAESVKRVDQDDFELRELVIHLYKPDGKSDYRIQLPASVYDQKSGKITSDAPVTLTTDGFELKGSGWNSTPWPGGGSCWDMCIVSLGTGCGSLGIGMGFEEIWRAYPSFCVRTNL